MLIDRRWTEAYVELELIGLGEVNMPTMTLQDMADLAKVRRAVVSTWRNRPLVRGVSHPFPTVIERVDGQDRFDVADVVEYLKRTGRGNNPDVVDDAPAIAVPIEAALEDVVTLLAWHVLTGEDLAGTSHAYRVRRAAECDPDDRILLRELSRLHAADAVLDYTDQLLAASFGAADALQRVEEGQLGRREAARNLSSAATDLIASVVSACVVYLGGDGVALSVDGSELSLDVAGEAATAITTTERGIARRALIRGVQLGEPSRPTLLSFTSVIGREPADVLDAVDDVVLDLEAGHIAIVVGPASILADDLTGPLQGRRASVLRVENVVAALRLPRGYWREAHRQSLALWVCLGDARRQRPVVGDLCAADTIANDDVAADVAAALSGESGRAFRYGRLGDVSTILAGGALVPRGVQPPRIRLLNTGNHVEAVHAATLTTSVPLAPLDVLVQPSPGRLQVAQRSLGQLRADGKLTLKRGNRIDLAFADPNGTVNVLPEPVSGAARFDPVDAEQRYPRSARTNPGDVVFVEHPRPQAWVDVRGGSMVASPARILRLEATAEIGPRLLAAAINRLPATPSEWQSWSVPVMTGAEAQRLEEALAEVDAFEVELRQRAAAAKDLASALIDGVAAGALTLDAAPMTVGAAAPQRGN